MTDKKKTVNQFLALAWILAVSGLLMLPKVVFWPGVLLFERMWRTTSIGEVKDDGEEGEAGSVDAQVA